MPEGPSSGWMGPGGASSRQVMLVPSRVARRLRSIGAPGRPKGVGSWDREAHGYNRGFLGPCCGVHDHNKVYWDRVVVCAGSGVLWLLTAPGVLAPGAWQAVLCLESRPAPFPAELVVVLVLLFVAIVLHFFVGSDSFVSLFFIVFELAFYFLSLVFFVTDFLELVFNLLGLFSVLLFLSRAFLCSLWVWSFCD